MMQGISIKIVGTLYVKALLIETGNHQILDLISNPLLHSAPGGDRKMITCSRWGHLQGSQSQWNSFPSARNQLKKIPFRSPGRSRKTKDMRSRNRMLASCLHRRTGRPLDCGGSFCLPAAVQAEGGGRGQLDWMRGHLGRMWQG